MKVITAKKLIILFCFPIISFGQHTTIPDSNFEQALIDLGYDNIIDGKVLTTKIKSIISLEVAGKNISSLDGIQDFISLVVLECNNNQLTSLDLSNNITLEVLNCDYNKLKKVDLSDNISLKKLSLRNCGLKKIDVSNNIQLEELYLDNYGDLQLGQKGADFLAFYNTLKSLDVRQNTLLQILWCGSNKLTNLDVSQNILLKDLSCSYNQLTALNISKDPIFFEFDCSNNKLNSLEIKNIIIDTVVTIYENDGYETRGILIEETKTKLKLVLGNKEVTFYKNEILGFEFSTTFEYFDCSSNNFDCNFLNSLIEEKKKQIKK